MRRRLGLLLHLPLILGEAPLRFLNLALVDLVRVDSLGSRATAAFRQTQATSPEWVDRALPNLSATSRSRSTACIQGTNLSQKHRVHPQTEPDGNRKRADQVAYHPHGLTFVWQLLCMGHDRNLPTDVRRVLLLLIRRSCEGSGLPGSD
jgi:hypothetical protein